MTGPFAYLLWLGIFVALPLAALRICFRRVLSGTGRVLFRITACIFAIAVPWDYLAIHRWHIWRFPDGRHLGVDLLGIPIEEYIFMTGMGMLFTLFSILLMRGKTP